MRQALVLAVALVVLASTSCSTDGVDGSGTIITETRAIDPFDRIVLAGEGVVRFAAGTDGTIDIETDDNLLAHISTEVSDGTLTIATEAEEGIDPSDGVVYRLGCPALRSVALTGAGRIDTAGCQPPAPADQLTVTMSGAGTIEVPRVAAATVEVVLSGAGTIEAEGRVDQLEVEISGAGSFDGGDLEASIVDVRTSGVGSTTVWAVDTLEVTLSGVGGVRYFGDPTVAEELTGVGQIESLGPK